MDEPIDSVKRSNAITSGPARIGAAKPAAPVKREHEGGDFVFEDKLDISPEAHLASGPDQIDLSLEMIRALIAGELPEEAITALESFAPIGDLGGASELCDRVQSKPADFITWEKTQSLAQALAIAAA
jgi:hypothetical protein